MTSAPQHPLRFLARVTIQFDTAFIIGSGQNDLFYDDVFVADANGLPALPGSSLAGILRHAWEDAGYGSADHLFGFQHGSDGHGSRLSVSWGCIHNQNNRPVEGIILDRQSLIADPVLSEALMTTARDHVRIDHKGTTAKGGKFDERSVSAGHRFTFELLLEGNQTDQAEWHRLLALLNSDTIRIGGKTRRGYGQFSVIKLQAAVFDITTPDGFAAFANHPVALAQQSGLPDLLAELPTSSLNSAVATLRLQPEAFWMIGGGFDTEVDMAPLTANRIVWRGDTGDVEKQEKAILTGSAIKGALSHRVAFHYNRLTAVFAGKDVDPQQHTGTQNKAVAALFGSEKNNTAGQRGRVIISDLFVEQPGPQKVLNHVSIDRFTGGARTLEGALFDEKPYYRGAPFTLTIAVTETDTITEPAIRQALQAALEDLAGGRLALGAGAGRGNGYFKGDIIWNGPGEAWLAGGAA